jgi:HEAT repeat protein
MAKSRNLDAKLSRLAALRREIAVPEHIAELSKALEDKSNLVVAHAAETAGERVLSELAHVLVAAFYRFMINAETSDKLCRAKLAIVEALNKIEYDKEDVFLAGIRHIQMEPRWGGPADTADHLRGSAAFGLVRINYHDVVLLLADLLADKEKLARVAAAQALGETRSPAAIPLLRFKAHMGDLEPEVTSACLTALMTADVDQSLPFIARFLDHSSEEIQHGAAFALAESRRPDALEILAAHWPKAQHGSLQAAMLLAISMTRLPAALEFLLQILAGDSPTAALSALSALAISRHIDSVKDRVAAIVAKTGDAALQESFKKQFER